MAWNANRQAFRRDTYLWVRVEPDARAARRHARCAPARIQCAESSGRQATIACVLRVFLAALLLLLPFARLKRHLADQGAAAIFDGAS